MPPISIRFTHLKYTACVADPDEFSQREYRLDVDLQERIEIMIVMTIYNEDEELFLKSFRAVRRNLQYLLQQWGYNQGWRRIVLCIIADGRARINQKTLAMMGILGLYQEGLVTSKIQDVPVTAHIFETICAVGYSSYNNDVIPGLCPVQVIFCLKERNMKKINSHRWALNAFATQLCPKVVILLDCGTIPTPPSFFHLWKEFHHHPTVAGCCGEIFVRLDWKILNPLVACQHFEYKISQLLDKRFESACGYISVLPGAFSAFRFQALTKEVLDKYFQGEFDQAKQNLYYANMFLAEDRILCHELFTMKNEKWRLRYVQKAMAETDVPQTVASYILQRRRWINGTFFSNIHSVSNFYQIFRTNHSATQKTVFIFQTIYNILMLLLNWFNIATSYLFFYLLTIGYRDEATNSIFSNHLMVIILNQIYLFSLLTVLISSLGNKPNSSGYLYRVMFIIFCLLSGIMLFLSTIRLYDELLLYKGSFDIKSFFHQSSSFRDLFLSVFMMVFIFLMISILYLDPWHMITSWLPYSILILCSTNILFVYAFANLSDVTWGNRPVDNEKESLQTSISLHQGTKTANIYLPAHQGEIDDSYKRFFHLIKQSDSNPDEAHAAMSREEYFKLYRTRLLVAWIISNSLVVLVVTSDSAAQLIGGDSTTENNIPLSFFFYSLSAAVILKAIGSIVYKMQRVVQENQTI